MDVAIAWENLVQAVMAAERQEGDWEVLAATCMAAMEMLLEFPPQEVLAQIEQSPLPTRATVSWLAFEGCKLGPAIRERGLALAACWQLAHPGQELIAPPPGASNQPLTLC